MGQGDPGKRITEHERQHNEVSERGDEAGQGAPANALGLGLVLAGAMATAIAMFLPFAQPVDGLPVLGKNTLFQLIGWHVLLLPVLLAAPGYRVIQGKQLSRWALIAVDVLVVVVISMLAIEKDLRTMHLIGPGGTADSSGPGIL